MKVIWEKCWRCSGVGMESVTTPSGSIGGTTTYDQVCRECNGDKVLSRFLLSEDLVDNISTIKEKVDWLKKNVKEILKHFDIEEK